VEPLKHAWIGRCKSWLEDQKLGHSAGYHTLDQWFIDDPETFWEKSETIAVWFAKHQPQKGSVSGICLAPSGSRS